MVSSTQKHSTYNFQIHTSKIILNASLVRKSSTSATTKETNEAWRSHNDDYLTKIKKDLSVDDPSRYWLATNHMRYRIPRAENDLEHLSWGGGRERGIYRRVPAPSKLATLFYVGEMVRGHLCVTLQPCVGESRDCINAPQFRGA